MIGGLLLISGVNVRYYCCLFTPMLDVLPCIVVIMLANIKLLLLLLLESRCVQYLWLDLDNSEVVSSEPDQTKADKREETICVYDC